MGKNGSNVISLYKSLILAVVVGLYVYIASKSENSVLLNFVILYILISIVYLLFRKLKNKKVRKDNLIKSRSFEKIHCKQSEKKAGDSSQNKKCPGTQ